MTIEIEKNIPVPSRAGRTGGESKYPFKDMDIGDSFFTDKNITSMVYKKAKELGVTFTIRVVAEDVVEGTAAGYRVWRTA